MLRWLSRRTPGGPPGAPSALPRPATGAHESELSVGHGGSSGRWLVSYADFVTLMFGFFLILWASADTNDVHFANMAQAFHRAFNNGAMLGQAGSGQIAGKGGRTAQMEMSPFQRVSETTGELVAQMGLQNQVSVGMRREGLVITLSGNLLFDSGRAELRPEALDVLARLATVLSAEPGQIRIEGHTDDIPLDPSVADYPSNWELSSRRSASVLRFLSETVGLPAERFQIAGYAEFRPLVPNNSRENRAQNRRVELILLSPSGAGLSVPSAPAAETTLAPAAPSEPPSAPPAKH